MRLGGIVLCGGQSARMGQPKAWLPFGGEFLLSRVVRIACEVAEPVVVVAAPGQDVPPLPREVEIARDELGGRGPLGGLAAGLAALESRCDAVYLSSCDVPFLRAAFVRRVCELLLFPSPARERAKQKAGEVFTRSVQALTPHPSAKRGHPLPQGEREKTFAAVPRVNGYLHPLAAAYRVEALPAVRAMLAAGNFRMTDLFERIPTRVIGPEELTDADPELVSLRNLNTPEEYAAALKVRSEE